MATQILPETEAATTEKRAATKYVYFFGGGKADGHGKMKDELGGKGAGLAEMTNAGLPVPPGFTIQTEACREYMRTNGVSAEVDRQMEETLKRLEELQGQKLGKGENPLLVSVRSGAKFSMPGMMDTILNLGLNDESVEALARRSKNPRFAVDSYRRLIQMFGNVVLDIPKPAFDGVFDAKKEQKKTKHDTDLDAKALKEVIEEYKKVVKKHTKRDFPQDPHEQLVMARDAVFRSWQNDRAKHYRRINNISDDLGTAVNVQAMVFGNLGDTSGTGVGFTRNPANGTKEFYGEFLMNAQGEDVVAGIRTPVPILELEKIMPDVYRQLREITTRLEKHYRGMQDFEFTIQDGKLYMLQTRNGQSTGVAQVVIALQMVEEGLITKEEAIFRVDPNRLIDVLVPRVDEKDVKPGDVLSKRGLPASPGGATGQVVFAADEVVERKREADDQNQKNKEAIKRGRRVKTNTSFILVRAETTPEDIHGMEVAAGILTSRGGMTSHAAVVTRGMGKCCVAGAEDVDVNQKAREMRVKGQVFKEGDWITLDGTTGRVIRGKKKLLPPDPAILAKLDQFMSWAEPFRTMKVRANADVPRDAIQARAFGAEGIGLCRTEHMFFDEKKLPHMRAMILAREEKYIPAALAEHNSESGTHFRINQLDSNDRTAVEDRAKELARRAALKKLLPMQRSDFIGVFRAMDGLPVTIRTLDPPLHEFLPPREDLMVEIAVLEATKPRSPKLKGLKRTLRRVEELHEVNPMLGHRGCRLGISYPEITEMQARAIFEAAVAVAKEGVKVYPEVMIPLIATAKEMAHQAAIVHRVAAEVFKEKGKTVDYLVGTMIELPRAALVADEIAKEAQFFSFGTNDLTQTTFGFSRDDVNKILPTYLAEGILKQDPFAALDREGVGQLVRMATERGRKTRPTLKVGICGEHGGEPSSVEFCHQVGLNYVSCSPFRVLTARLAAAQAAASDQLKVEGGRTK